MLFAKSQAGVERIYVDRTCRSRHAGQPAEDGQTYSLGGILHLDALLPPIVWSEPEFNSVVSASRYGAETAQNSATRGEDRRILGICQTDVIATNRLINARSPTTHQFRE